MTVDPATDRTPLVHAAMAGDEAAFEALVRGEYRTLVMAARGILGDFHEGEDAACEALVEAWRGLGALRDPASFGPWLSRILTRTARRRARRPGPVPRETVDAPAPAQEEDPRLDGLLRALGNLPEPHREVLSLHYLRGHTLQEIAGAVGVPEKTVKSRLHEARKLLRRRLEDEEGR